jgi:hypothetical protein
MRNASPSLSLQDGYHEACYRRLQLIKPWLRWVSQGTNARYFVLKCYICDDGADQMLNVELQDRTIFC